MKLRWYWTVKIDDEKISLDTLDNYHKVKRLSKVRKVIDRGDFYCICFTFTGAVGIRNDWVCQKNLITKGTIEEFEKLFEGKFIRKI